MLIVAHGTYGSAETPTVVYGYERDGVTWYVCHGSVNVNATTESLFDGVNVEELTDITCFTSSEPITDQHMLEAHASEMHDYFNEAGW